MNPTARQEKLLALLESRGLGALVVTDSANVRYLTGYVGSNGVALIGAGGRVLLTDSRYAVSATEQVQGAEVVIGRRDLLADVAAHVGDVAAGGAIGVEAESLTVARYDRLRELLGGLATEPTRGLVEGLRVIKDAGEVDAMRRAAAAVDQALETVLSQGIVGRAEREVAFALHGAMLDAGATEPSFATIVAAGPNGARPHHVPGTDVIPADTLVVIDLGAVVDGYCSDMTRTVATGTLPPRLEEIYASASTRRRRRWRRRAAAWAPPSWTPSRGPASPRAATVSTSATAWGTVWAWMIHERPGVRPESADALEAGMAVTIEPGIYLEGEAGVRIEDP